MPRRSIQQRDRAIGARICLARVGAAMSQRQLGDRLGLSQQQVRRYEAGLNRIAAVLLLDVAAALGRPIAWFLESDEREVAMTACFGAPKGKRRRRSFGRAMAVLTADGVSHG